YSSADLAQFLTTDPDPCWIPRPTKSCVFCGGCLEIKTPPWGRKNRVFCGFLEPVGAESDRPLKVEGVDSLCGVSGENSTTPGGSRIVNEKNYTKNGPLQECLVQPQAILLEFLCFLGRGARSLVDEIFRTDP